MCALKVSDSLIHLVLRWGLPSRFARLMIYLLKNIVFRLHISKGMFLSPFFNSRVIVPMVW
jgi:hypothetical protein